MTVIPALKEAKWQVDLSEFEASLKLVNRPNCRTESKEKPCLKKLKKGTGYWVL